MFLLFLNYYYIINDFLFLCNYSPIGLSRTELRALRVSVGAVYLSGSNSFQVFYPLADVL